MVFKLYEKKYLGFHTYLDDTLEVDIHAIWELESLKKDENYIRKLSLYSSTIFSPGSRRRTAR